MCSFNDLLLLRIIWDASNMMNIPDFTELGNGMADKSRPIVSSELCRLSHDWKTLQNVFFKVFGHFSNICCGPWELRVNVHSDKYNLLSPKGEGSNE